MDGRNQPLQPPFWNNRVSQRTNKGQPPRHLVMDYELENVFHEPDFNSTPMPDQGGGAYKFPSDESAVSNVTIIPMQTTKSTSDTLMQELLKKFDEMSAKITQTTEKQNADVDDKMNSIMTRLDKNECEMERLRFEMTNKHFAVRTTKESADAQPSVRQYIGAIPKHTQSHAQRSVETTGVLTMQGIPSEAPRLPSFTPKNLPYIDVTNTQRHSSVPRQPFVPSQPFESSYPFEPRQLFGPRQPFVNQNSVRPPQEARRKLHDLPVFTGNPEEWPMFSAAFYETTIAYGYSDLENLIRLQKSLQAKARLVVEAMLVYPNNVPCIMEELQFRFGRQELIIRSQLKKMYEIQQISDDNYDQLIEYSSKVRNFVAFLRGAGADYHLNNYQLVEELVAKLPNARRMDWAYELNRLGGIPTVIMFADWLFAVARVASRIENATNTVVSRTSTRSKPLPITKKYTLHTTDTTKLNEHVKCNYCSQNHVITECPKMLQIPVSERWTWMKQSNACFGCLNLGHRLIDCRKKKKCSMDDCKKTHHILLHETDKNVTETDEEKHVAVGPVLNVQQNDENVFFKVVAVTVIGPNNEKINTFAILDDASAMTFMESSLANELNLVSEMSETIELAWLDDTTNKCQTSIVNCRIQGRDSFCQEQELRKIRLMDKLSLPCQTMKIQQLMKQYPQLAGLGLRGYLNARPRMLIGLNNARLGYAKSYVDCSPLGPVAIQTSLGWILYGSNESPHESQHNRHVLIVHESLRREYDELHDLVSNFHEIENFGITNPIKELESREVLRARKILQETTRQLDKHYEVGLLWKSDEIEMPNSYNMAMKRMKLLDKKMNCDLEYGEKYKKAMKEFMSKNYARKLSSTEASELSNKTWYLPHFAVFNPNKPGKLRIVFDAAATVNRVSLNSQLLKGPDLNQPLVAVLSQFREGPIAVCGDIQEMFLQVKIRQEDRHSQRFLWKEEDEIEIYEMTSMIFGATCAPTAAQYVKNVHAEKYRTQYPEAVHSIQNNHYVDDFVKSFECEEVAIIITNDIVKIHEAAGFKLHKIVSNSSKVVTALNQNAEVSSKLTSLNVEAQASTEKILGLYWKNDVDTFVFELKFQRVPEAVLRQQRNPTKREMLCQAMSIFDPFGFIANLHIYAKILIQEIWKLNLDWDDQVPDDVSNKWYQWQTELNKVKEFEVPRCYSSKLKYAKEIELHIFVDASQEAYVAVSYWRIQLPDEVVLSFVYGKTRVAPRKLLSIPRLELQAAILGIRMKQSVLASHTIKPVKCYFWSDSKTVIHWTRSNCHIYKPFVAHRVAEILEHSDPNDWNWVPTTLNVADDATRAKYPIRYDHNSRWLTGPEFLLQPSECWPKVPDVSQSEVPIELRKTSTVLIVKSIDELSLPTLTRFSKYNRLVRTVAWMHRFTFNIKAKQNKNELRVGELSATELNDAEMYICRTVQQTTFEYEYHSLQNHRPITQKSDLYKLSPYLHDDGIIRVNGRIDAASEIPFATRKPIILPKDHELTRLIVAYYHEKYCHQYHETVICQLRLKFWIPSIRTLLRKVRSSCQLCKIRCAKPQQPLMGQLPVDRVTGFVRPFTYTGIDYFGPYEIVVGRSTVKRWVALFTCSTTRAVHVEIAHDLSTDACILCIRNFVNLRGIPKRIRSDNGTNFVGLHNELCNVSDFFDHDKIKSKFASFGIEWLFNCPADPSAGGAWERLVQSIKRALKSSLENRKLQEHTFRSFLLEAMNIVNSRPLTHIPISPEDQEPLTPNHFLVGECNSTQTPGSCNERLMCLRKQWRIAQQVKNHFYKRWVTEYLPVLTRRCKWFEQVPPLKIGEIVVICDPDAARSQWKMGRIIETVTARDGQVRQAVIKTSSGVLRRPAHKLAVLNVEVNSEVSSRGRECHEHSLSDG